MATRPSSAPATTTASDLPLRSLCVKQRTPERSDSWASVRGFSSAPCESASYTYTLPSIEPDQSCRIATLVEHTLCLSTEVIHSGWGGVLTQYTERLMHSSISKQWSDICTWQLSESFTATRMTQVTCCVASVRTQMGPRGFSLATISAEECQDLNCSRLRTSDLRLHDPPHKRKFWAGCECDVL